MGTERRFGRLLPALAAGLAALMLAGAAAAFPLTDAAGKVHKLSDYRGRWVLVNFWATWCPPCIEELPELQSLFESRRDVMVIGVSLDEGKSRQAIVEFADGMFVTYPIVLGDSATTAYFGRIRSLPTTLIYDPDGNLASTKIGAVTRQSIEKFIQEQSRRRPVAPGASARLAPR